MGHLNLISKKSDNSAKGTKTKSKKASRTNLKKKPSQQSLAAEDSHLLEPSILDSHVIKLEKCGTGVRCSSKVSQHQSSIGMPTVFNQQSSIKALHDSAGPKLHHMQGSTGL
mmetsp:Transcript_39243/g.59871  ORF Transcript_39243/g.59871 Transcript_39243/m.59871 type:complete len:112 (+) Transcript_39243:460-795(+)